MTNHIIKNIIISFIIILFFSQVNKSQDLNHYFILKNDIDGLTIEKEPISPGEMKVIQSNETNGIIDIILPVGTGGSGSVAKLSEEKLFIVRNNNGEIKVTIQTKEGEKYEQPARKFTELAQQDIRLSVISEDGSYANYFILHYDEIVKDNIGPTVDLFGGMIPLQKNDYVLFTDTSPVETRDNIFGSADLEYVNGYLYAKVDFPDGKSGLFIIDIGAAVSVVTKEFVGDDFDIKENYMMEYSSGKAKKLKYSPTGGTGAITTIEGYTIFESLTLGDMTFHDVSADVITELPIIGKRKVDGIIGHNIISQAPYLTLSYKKNDKSKLILSDKPAAIADKEISLPFVSVGKIMYVKGKLNNNDISFIMDSGAQTTFISPKSAKILNIDYNTDSAFTYQGGGGQQDKGVFTSIDGLTFNDITFDKQKCAIGEIVILQRVAANQASGLLGNSFFEQFDSIEIDYVNNRVKFKYL